MRDECQHLLTLLGDLTLQEIALLKLDGASNESIAETLNLSLRTVGRRIALIRKHWEQHLEAERE